ncbi:MAG TPA: FMN-binding negative transcriptional regulator [Allosphingosinicella sp.]
MHPHPRFAWTDKEEILAFIADIAFCSVFAAGETGAAVFHVPVIVHAPDRIRFHVSNANRGAAGLDGRRALLSCLGPDAYVSPDWYGTPDQVPTWNYVAAEAEGPLRLLSEEELAGLLDDLSDVHEARLDPKPRWTRDKMSPGRFEAMLRAITGYELRIEDLRGTRKLGQTKGAAETEGAIAGLEGAGHQAIAALMRAASSSPSTDGEGAHAQHGGGVEAEAPTIPLHHPSDGPPPHASRREE